MNWKIHPFAHFLPSATDAEYRNIRDDIRENGLKVPLLLFNGKLLDGRTRLKACQELGIRPSYESFCGTEMEALRRIQSLNVFRRHLNQGQKAVVAGRIAMELQRCKQLTVKESQTTAAKAAGASLSSTREAATIERVDPGLADKVLNGEKTLEQAKQKIRPTPPPVQSVRYLSTAIVQIRHSLAEMRRRRCPEQKRLEELLLELEDIRARLAAWAERKSYAYPSTRSRTATN